MARFHTLIGQLIALANTGFITKILQKYNVLFMVPDQPVFYDWTSFSCVLV